ncbi:hemin uptake protein HemP [Brucella intermedia]|uniref:hemin uptake protein HemP n=1 Tax=Brucella intermedia TaxID=94625 RepID=UPI00224B8611|nr:hemin uptake protein HemP [Brucella intermedia]
MCDTETNPKNTAEIPHSGKSRQLFTYPGGKTVRLWSSEKLLGAEDEAVIEHGGETYRLRLTRQGGLILNK